MQPKCIRYFIFIGILWCWVIIQFSGGWQFIHVSVRIFAKSAISGQVGIYFAVLFLKIFIRLMNWSLRCWRLFSIKFQKIFFSILFLTAKIAVKSKFEFGQINRISICNSKSKYKLQLVTLFYRYALFLTMLNLTSHWKLSLDSNFKNHFKNIYQYITLLNASQNIQKTLKQNYIIVVE